MEEQVFCAFLGNSPREDFIPYVADFYLQLEDVKWTIALGIVNDSLVMSVRNLGYSRNAGDFVRKYFNESAAPAVTGRWRRPLVPLRAFRDKFGNLQADEFTNRSCSSRWNSSMSTIRGEEAREGVEAERRQKTEGRKQRS
jgi:hypothetical protein